MNDADKYRYLAAFLEELASATEERERTGRQFRVLVCAPGGTWVEWAAIVLNPKNQHRIVWEPREIWCPMLPNGDPQGPVYKTRETAEGLGHLRVVRFVEATD